MKIVDKTPYRTETGEIDLFGRIQGMLKYGITWYDRVMAQDVVIAIIEKQLDSNYALLRNVTLPNTEIILPLVLIGPPGIYLINVTYERGIYLAKDDEWGTISEGRDVKSRHFIPARINQIGRTMTFGRVLQLYLDRQGFKDSVLVESILMASDPGVQVESTRPAVRIVMSDALERFAASLNQGRAMLNAPLARDLVKAILVGMPPKSPVPEPAAPPADAAEQDDRSSFGTLTSEPLQADDALSSDASSFDNQQADEQPPAAPVPAESAPADKKPAPKKKKLLGLTTAQLLILGGMLLCWLCIIVAAVAIYFFTNA